MTLVISRQRVNSLFFIAVAIIIIAWLLFCRRKPVEKEPFEDDPDDDIRENIMYYDEEGAGEAIYQFKWEYFCSVGRVPDL